MEILTMLKANIRHKKGSFASIIILMLIITMALAAILSVQDNIYDGIMEAHERADNGNVIAYMNVDKLSDSLRNDIENHKLVQKVVYKEAVPSRKVTCGNAEEYDNTVFFQEMDEGRRLLDAQEIESLGEAPELKEGEAYISQGMKTNFACEVGDNLTLTLQSGDYDFTIAGIVEDPLVGAAVIGWKNIFVSQKDFAKIYKEQEIFTKSEKEKKYTAQVIMVSVYKTEDCGLTDDQFARQLNLDTGFADISFGSITRDMSTHYTYLFVQVIGSILIVFVLLLLVAVIVIMCHSVSTGIEMEYTTLGVMKAQGFSKGTIRLILAAQYLLAQMIGAVIGMLLSVWLCRELGNVFYPITGIVPLKHVSILKCGGIIFGMLGISAVCIFLITRKIAEISPVRAISGGKKEIHFDSRLQMQIKKKMLSVSLALRQFTSNKKQYIGVIAIVSMLVFFMTTMMVLGNIITAQSAWKNMGILATDINITLKKSVGDDKIEEIEETVKEYSEIKDVCYMAGNFYYSVDGEQMMACVYRDAENILAVSEGRQPLYDNEIVMTEIAAESMGLKVGDRVTLGYGDKKGEYIISGLNQFMNDAGKNFSITIDAAKKLANHEIFYMGYMLEDVSAGNKIVQALEKKFGDVMEAEFVEEQMDASYEMAIYFMTAVVYIFSAIFAVVVTHIVCSKAFLRERTDIGIYKALGFTSKHLRLQFAARFLIVAVLGSIVGGVLAAMFSGNVLSLLLRMIGISSFSATFYVHTFAVPVAMICGCFYLFAFMEAGRVKKVEVRELIVE